MALHTKKQFAELCGLTLGNLSNYATRGKVIYSGDYVDDTIEPNISFLTKWGNKNKSKLESENEIAEIPEVQEVAFNDKKTKLLNIADPEIKTKRPNVREAKVPGESRQEVLKNELLIEQIELARQKKEKNLGLTIPFDLATQSGATAFKQAFIQIKNVLDKRLNRWSDTFTPEQLAKERSETLKEINQAILTAIEAGEKSMQEIILLSSNKKEVGEREA